MRALAKIKAQLEGDIKILRDPDYGYIRAGLPRFPAFFGRDSCIISWQLLDFDKRIAAKTIEILSRYQGKKIEAASEEEPGKILHEWHPNPAEYKFVPWPLPYYGSIDSTPLFIFLCHLYYEKTTDSGWLEKYWPNIEAALGWCANFGDLDSDLMLEYKGQNHVSLAHLTHQGWKDSLLNHLDIKPPVELVEVQGYYYAALNAASDLALTLGKETLAQELVQRAVRLKKRFLADFWLAEDRFFALAMEKSRIPIKRITSNPGHLLFSGILDGEERLIKALIEKLFSKAMWTPYGIRTHSTENPDFNPMSYHLGSIWPHDNWIIAQGLKRNGYVEEYEKIKEALLSAFEKLDAIPELYTFVGGKIQKIPVACWPQGWAAGALLNFIITD